MDEKWWHWHWDRLSRNHTSSIPYQNIVRWRRGWITLYKFVGDHATEWRLYFPFNICIGISLND